MQRHITQTKPKALVPTLSEIILFPILSFFILIIFTFDRITSDFGLRIEAIDLPGKLAVFYESILSIILPNFATALSWAIVGLGIYFIMWLFVDTGSRATEANSRTHRFIYPDRESRYIFLFTLFGQLYLRTVSFVTLIIWCLLLIKIAPPLADYFYLDSWSPSALFAPMLLGAYFFIGAAVMRLIFLRPRVFSDTE